MSSINLRASVAGDEFADLDRGTPTEFQAVILAGGAGNRLYPITEGDTVKALLPVANRPLLSYQLELLETCGFQSVIIITSEGASARISTYLADSYKNDLRIDLIVTPDGIETGDALLYAKDKIKSDFIVVSGDLILDGTTLQNMADVHRTTDAAITALLHPITIDPSLKKKIKEPIDCIGLDSTTMRRGHRLTELESSSTQINLLSSAIIPSSSSSRTKGSSAANISLSSSSSASTDWSQQLVYFCPASTLENQSSLTVPKLLLTRYPNITLHRDLLDAHFYIFSHWVLNYLQTIPEPRSIKTSLIPRLVQFQYNNEGVPEEALQNEQSLAYSMSSGTRLEDKLRCYGYVMELGYCRRVNSQQSFMEVNRDIAKELSTYRPFEPISPKEYYVDPTAVLQPKTMVGAQCVIGERTEIGVSSVKHTIIGKHCKIGEKVKLVNSVIMDHCTIGDGVTIQNSIICSNANIPAGQSVKDQTICAEDVK